MTGVKSGEQTGAVNGELGMGSVVEEEAVQKCAVTLRAALSVRPRGSTTPSKKPTR